MIDAVEIGPDARRVVPELMCRELGITTATANESARRLSQVARFSLSVSRFAGWKRTQGPLEGNRGPLPLVIAAPDSQQSKRPHENRQTNVARRASLNQLSARSERQPNGTAQATSSRSRPNHLFWRKSFDAIFQRRESLIFSACRREADSLLDRVHRWSMI